MSRNYHSHVKRSISSKRFFFYHIETFNSICLDCTRSEFDWREFEVEETTNKSELWVGNAHQYQCKSDAMKIWNYIISLAVRCIMKQAIRKTFQRVCCFLTMICFSEEGPQIKSVLFISFEQFSITQQQIEFELKVKQIIITTLGIKHIFICVRACIRVLTTHKTT